MRGHQAFWGWTASDVLHGRPGTSLGKLEEWLEDVGPFDVALVLLGINDAAKGLASDFKTHYSSIVSAIAGLPFKPDIILAKPLPILSREFVASSQVIANAVEETGRDSGAPVVDLGAGKYSNDLTSMLGDDGVHPNWAGDAAIAEGWLTALRRIPRKTEM